MFGLDCSSVALDMTNFATFIDTGNGKVPIAQRGEAKQKRSDLRPVGLGLVVTRGGGIPLAWHAHPGDRPDVTQFPAMVDQLRGHYEAICAAAATAPAADITVVFDAGQNSESNFAHLAQHEPALHRVGARLGLPGPDRPARLSQNRG
jgi:transposase